jgi:hypothetical protein
MIKAGTLQTTPEIVNLIAHTASKRSQCATAAEE